MSQSYKDEMARRQSRYQEKLPEDGKQAWPLLENYSKIPPHEIEAHLRAVRDRAWTVFPYACIGGWRFLDLYVRQLPEYAAVVERLRTGEVLLDAGCCFGHVLRQLAVDGVPASHLVGSDLRQEFIDLGFQLFRDRDTFGGRFVTGDMLAAEPTGGDPGLVQLDNSVDIIHAASFFHLFGWDDQVRLGKRMVRFFRPESEAIAAAAAKTAKSTAKISEEAEAPAAPADLPTSQAITRPRLIFGRQVGAEQPLDPATPAARSLSRFHHNQATMQRLFDEIGLSTATRWKVDARLVPIVLREDGTKHVMIQFAVYKLE